MTNKFTQAPRPVRHARLIGIIHDVQNEIAFSLKPEAAESALALLQEAEEIIRSLQSEYNAMTMVAE